MKTKPSNSTEQIKKLNHQQGLNHSSVSFRTHPEIMSSEVKKELNPFQELKDALKSGDDMIWRMWR
jgi:hypothetical protein